MKLRIPLILLIFSATTLPIELRAPSLTLIDLNVELRDIFWNITGYLPLGVVLADLGAWRALLIGGLLSVIAEIGQIFIPDRFPSPVDVVSNIIGTGMGIIFALRCCISDVAISIGQWTAGLAVVCTLVLLSIGVTSGHREVMQLPSNDRGATSTGALEGYWRFDQVKGGVTPDSSGNGLDGKLMNGAHPTRGRRGSGAVRFPRPEAFVDLGNPVALRLTGSMTVSAWIYSSSFPADDAVIVSSRGARQGYQLDTTVDEGARTIGFKLYDMCGNAMVRYGVTELKVDTWYHVTGVYDAAARTLDVYLNGRLDDGTLLGRVTAGQQPSGQHVYIGRRPDSDRYPFAGSIADLRIYSLPLDHSKIERDMNEVSAGHLLARSSGEDPRGEYRLAHPVAVSSCVPSATARDAMLPLFAVSLGMLLAITVTGFWKTPTRLRVVTYVLGGLIAGPVILATGVSALPWYRLWMLPLYGVAGAISVAASTHATPPLEPFNS